MKHIISILFICLSNMTSQAQNSPSDLNRKFVNYLTSSLSESIYLQTDKPYYTTEDTLACPVESVCILGFQKTVVLKSVLSACNESGTSYLGE